MHVEYAAEVVASTRRRDTVMERDYYARNDHRERLSRQEWNVSWFCEDKYDDIYDDDKYVEN